MSNEKYQIENLISLIDHILVCILQYWAQMFTLEAGTQISIIFRIKLKILNSKS